MDPIKGADHKDDLVRAVSKWRKASERAGYGKGRRCKSEYDAESACIVGSGRIDYDESDDRTVYYRELRDHIILS